MWLRQGEGCSMQMKQLEQRHIMIWLWRRLSGSVQRAHRENVLREVRG